MSAPAARAPASYRSWGRYPEASARHVEPVADRAALPDLRDLPQPVLPYGLGRSYGDSCLNAGGTLLLTDRLSRIIAFDGAAGVLRCEAGVSLASILEVAVPRGWFLPVTPGTRFVTVGGAIANDVHGKNHHVRGTFGMHVTALELLRSTGERVECSPHRHPRMFEATIGGLGLTGLITWAELRLRRIGGPLVDVETVRLRSLEEFFDVSAASDGAFEYTVAWVDCLARGASLGRGSFIRGNHAAHEAPGVGAPGAPRIGVPFDMPGWLLSPLTVRCFNALYYRKQRAPLARGRSTLGPFFYPLDGIADWNRLYGRRGFLQYQCVVPMVAGAAAMRAVLDRIARSGQASFLAVLKVFGAAPSPGLLSFPRPGVTLALDLPNRGPSTLALLEALDAIVAEAGGALYPAKDARMSSALFRRSFPRLDEFLAHVDPAFSSSFWRRVSA